MESATRPGAPPQLEVRVHCFSWCSCGSETHPADHIKVKTFKQYVEMYLNSAAAEAAENSGGAAQVKPSVTYERINDRWEVAFAVSEGSFQHVSFANSISTIKGGTHVNNIADQIAKTIIATIKTKNKGAVATPQKVKDHMWLFVNALIENPTFDSQTKETMTLPASKFGSKPLLSEEFLKKGIILVCCPFIITHHCSDEVQNLQSLTRF